MTTDISTIEQELTEAIVKAVPEIAELKLGCVVEVGVNAGSFRNYTCGGQYNRFTMIGRCNPPTDSMCLFLQPIGVCHVDETELMRVHTIIGRPITLDDICRALIAANEFTMTNFEKLFTHYIFGRPLNEQDDTVKRLLHSLLCQ